MPRKDPPGSAGVVEKIRAIRLKYTSASDADVVMNEGWRGSNEFKGSVRIGKLSFQAPGVIGLRCATLSLNVS